MDRVGGRGGWRRRGTRLRGLLIGTAAALVFAVFLLGGCADLGPSGASTTTTAPSRVSTTEGPGNGPGATSGAGGSMLVSPAELVAARVGPSVVNVKVEGTIPGFFGNQPFGSEGSGVIYTPDGMIVTNNHVVTQETQTGEVQADKITVTLATGEKLPARVVGRDPLTDLAVLKVDKTGLPAASFLEDFSQVKIGQYAIAIGSPLGFENSVTMGIISGVQREIDAPGPEGLALIDLIQTDAAISPGNSGGALVDAQGRVIGINVAYLPPGQTGAQNLGFAIPADVVNDVARQIIQTGRATHAYLGIRNVAVTEELQQRFNLSRSSGVLVAATDPGTPAARAGLKQGDIIFKINDTDISSDVDLFKFLRRKKPGDTVSVTFDRNGKTQTVQVTLGERPQ
ncbi:MAG: hypothetical protein Kow00122_20710 [Thermoleophilia bacterium]